MNFSSIFRTWLIAIFSTVALHAQIVPKENVQHVLGTGNYVGTNAGAPLFSIPPGTTTANAVSTVAALRALSITSLANGTQISVAGYYAAADGGGGPVRVLSTGQAPGTYTDNGGSVIVPTGGNGSAAWLWQWSGPVNVKWFGAKGDGVTLDTASVQAAITLIQTNGSGVVYFPASSGAYICGALSFNNNNGNVTLSGDGWQNTNNDVFGSANWATNVRGSVIRSTAASGNAILLSSILGSNIKNIAIIGPGSGTAIGVNVTSGIGASSQCFWENSLIANFAQGVDMNAMLSSKFDSVIIRGCTTGWKLSNSSNDNIFVNCQFEMFTVKGLWLVASAQNDLYGCLFQSFTGSGIYGETTGFRSLHVHGCYFESQAANTYAINLNGGDYHTIQNCWFSSLYGTHDSDRVNIVGSNVVIFGGNRSFNDARVVGTPFGVVFDDLGIPPDVALTGYTIKVAATGPTAIRAFTFPDADATILTSLTTTLTGINSVTSQAGQPLVLGTGSGGNAVSFASATKIATFAAPVLVGGGTAALPALSFATGSNAGLYVYDDGFSAGIGFSSAGVSAGTIDHLQKWTTVGAMTFSHYGAGAATFDASGNITSVSDARKKDIVGSFTRGLEAVRQLKPVTFHWRADSGLSTAELNAGFVAQDVLSVIPEAIGQDKEGFYTFADRPITAALVNAVKELDRRTQGHSADWPARILAGAALLLAIRANFKKNRP